MSDITGLGAGARSSLPETGDSKVMDASGYIDNTGNDVTASPSSSKASSSLTAQSQSSLTLSALRQHTASRTGKPLGLAEKVRGMSAGPEAGSSPEAEDSRRGGSKHLSDTEFLGKVMYAVTDQLSTSKSVIRSVRKLIQDKAYRHWCVPLKGVCSSRLCIG